MSAKEEILSEIASMTPARVDLPWLTNEVYVTLLGASEVIAMEGNLRPIPVVAAAACDAAGNKLFDESDVAKLVESGTFRTVSTIFAKACEFNGIELSRTQEEAKEAAEESAKNSE